MSAEPVVNSIFLQLLVVGDEVVAVILQDLRLLIPYEDQRYSQFQEDS